MIRRRPGDDGELPTRLEVAGIAAAAALGVQSVVSLGADEPGGAATYGPGACVHGVSVSQDMGRWSVAVHVVLRVDAGLPAGTTDLPAGAESVRAAVRAVMEDVGIKDVARIDVSIDDVVCVTEGIE